MSRLRNRLQHENAEPLALWVAERDSAGTPPNTRLERTAEKRGRSTAIRQPDLDMASTKLFRKDRMGALPRRYAFVLNPYADGGFTKCPGCEAKTR
jgi:hypothetical protein